MKTPTWAIIFWVVMLGLYLFFKLKDNKEFFRRLFLFFKNPEEAQRQADEEDEKRRRR